MQLKNQLNSRNARTDQFIMQMDTKTTVKLAEGF